MIERLSIVDQLDISVMSIPPAVPIYRNSLTQSGPSLEGRATPLSRQIIIKGLKIPARKGRRLFNTCYFYHTLPYYSRLRHLNQYPRRAR